MSEAPRTSPTERALARAQPAIDKYLSSEPMTASEVDMMRDFFRSRVNFSRRSPHHIGSFHGAIADQLWVELDKIVDREGIERWHDHVIEAGFKL